MKRKLSQIAALFIGAAIASQGQAIACPGCKEALFDPGQLAEKIATAKGYAWSIGTLLSVPFLLVATVALLVVRNTRKFK